MLNSRVFYLIVDYLILFISEIWSLCVQMSPYLLVGMFVSGFISIYVDSRLILKHIGSKDILSILKSTIFGIPIPLCSCGVIPVAATLRESGASKGSTVSFLVSTPQTGLDSIFLTYGMLGPVFALFRPLAAFISGIISGLIVNNFDDEKHHHLSSIVQSKNNNKTLISRLMFGIRYGFITLPADIVVPLFQGLLIAATIAIFVPPDFIAQYFSSSSYVIYIMMLAVSLPIYVCATASIPIAVSLMVKGVSAGAVFVFLMAGPATNASSITVVKNILGEKTMYLYLILISFTAVLFGFFLDSFFPIKMSTVSEFSHMHEDKGFGSLIISVLFILIMLNAYFYKYKSGIAKKSDYDSKFENSNNQLSIIVDGMTCSHCKENIENAIYSLNSVENTIVDLNTGKVLVVGSKLDKSAIIKKIQSVGFSIKK